MYRLRSIFSVWCEYFLSKNTDWKENICISTVVFSKVLLFFQMKRFLLIWISVWLVFNCRIFWIWKKFVRRFFLSKNNQTQVYLIKKMVSLNLQWIFFWTSVHVSKQVVTQSFFSSGDTTDCEQNPQKMAFSCSNPQDDKIISCKNETLQTIEIGDSPKGKSWKERKNFELLITM